jgi:catechol 2,3-dioxygenase-like lactoylglutathione lyase family enzyme
MLEALDVAETVAFYTDVLGFTCTDSIGEDGRLVWANLLKDDVTLMVTTFHTHAHDEGEEHDHEHLPAPALTGSIYFNVDDVDTLAIDLGGKVALAYGPETMPHGMREIGLLDPNGYLLVFGMPVEA